MASLVLPSLETLIDEVDKGIEALRPESELRVVAFFDLTRSTAMKIVDGHEVGARAALRFVAVAARLTQECHGVVVQKFGDGILCKFDNVVDACKAALNVKAATYSLDVQASFGLTIGQVSVYTHADGQLDLVGDAVDRCARIQSFASPGQILVDDTMYNVVRSHLTGLGDVVIGSSFDVEAKGIGRVKLWEFSTRDLGLVGRISTPFVIHAGGRLPISEKVQFMRNAEREIIEIGTGLTSFAKYITGQRPDEFRDPLRDLYRRDVTLRCYALDPDHAAGRQYLDEQGDTHYAQEMEQARRAILEERRECIRLGFPGRVEYHLYRLVPAFHCLGVDVDDPLNGRMLLSPYLGGHKRSAYPVHQLSRQSNPDLYEKYLQSIKAVRGASSPSMT